METAADSRDIDIPQAKVVVPAGARIDFSVDRIPVLEKVLAPGQGVVVLGKILDQEFPGKGLHVDQIAVVRSRNRIISVLCLHTAQQLFKQVAEIVNLCP